MPGTEFSRLHYQKFDFTRDYYCHEFYGHSIESYAYSQYLVRVDYLFISPLTTSNSLFFLVPRVPGVAIQYARCKQFQVFRLLFILYLLLPTAFLILQVRYSLLFVSIISFLNSYSTFFVGDDLYLARRLAVGGVERFLDYLNDLPYRSHFQSFA
jgi:hypothetical protein